MREIIKLVGVLTLICGICSALLATVYERTREPISKADSIRREKAAGEVLPPECAEMRDVVVNGVSSIAAYDKDGKLVGAAIEGASEHGYGGPIRLMVGISTAEKLIDFQVLSATETPGLGAKIESPAFRKRVQGKPLTSNWNVSKDGGDIDGITAATISSRAALEAIRDAIAKHAQLAAQLAGANETNEDSNQ